MSRDSAFHVEADTWEELFDSVRSRWAEMSAKHRKENTRRMALAIIRFTADDGVCTDAALRGLGFPQRDIDECGKEAAADANQMASNGPFSIVTLENANAA